MKRFLEYIKESKGLSILYYATQQDGLNKIKELLKEYPDEIKATNGKNANALHQSIEFNKNDISKYLIDNGIDVKQTRSDDKKPIHLCIDKNNFEIFKHLIIKDISTLFDYRFDGDLKDYIEKRKKYDRNVQAFESNLRLYYNQKDILDNLKNSTEKLLFIKFLKYLNILSDAIKNDEKYYDLDLGLDLGTLI